MFSEAYDHGRTQISVDVIDEIDMEKAKEIVREKTKLEIEDIYFNYENRALTIRFPLEGPESVDAITSAFIKEFDQKIQIRGSEIYGKPVKSEYYYVIYVMIVCIFLFSILIIMYNAKSYFKKKSK